MHSMQRIVSLLSRASGTPLGYALEKALSVNDFASVPELLSRVSPTSSFADKQTAALVSKLEGFDIGIDTAAKARDTFFECESACWETNIRLSRYVNWIENGFYGDSLDLHRETRIRQVRRIIGDILGPVPDITPRFSNGSTFHDKGEEITIPHKMQGVSFTPQFEELGLVEILRQTAWWRASQHATTVLGNRFSTVPKNFKTDRGICIEPSGNLSLQLAVGQVIRRRLYRVGIKIDGTGENNAQRIHRDYARWGSMSGECATIDLSNASDMIATNLVRLLLPREWFVFLNAIRSQTTTIESRKGKVKHVHIVQLEKFSSMGNGFTFELETLIFFAISRAVSPWAKAYGDDIVVPTYAAAAVVRELTFYGFAVNREKSYLSGPFRESCGGDYHEGSDTRPVYLKRIPASPLEWIDLYNSIRLMEAKSRSNATLLADSPELTEVKNLIKNEIPSMFRIYTPEHLGGLHTRDERKWIVRKATLCLHKREFAWGIGVSLTGRGYYEFKTPVPMLKRISLKRFDSHAQFAAALLGSPSAGVTPRGDPIGIRLTWLS